MSSSNVTVYLDVIAASVFTFDVICEAANVSVSEEAAIPLPSVLMLHVPTHIADLLMNVHCVVAKADIVQLMGGICL